MNGDTKHRIDNARDVLVGKLPDPKSQVEQITLALIYRFMDYMDRQSEEWGGTARFFTNGYEKYAWSNLVDRSLGGYERLDLYTEALIRMAQNPHLPQLFRDIFKNAYLPYRDPETLRMFLSEIDGFPLDHTEDLGDAYEYLLSVMSSQGQAGQFRTPRHIIDFIVKCVDPKKDETILDPACGTAGFLVCAYQHIMEQNTKDGIPGAALTCDEKAALVKHFSGYDISPDMVRLALVNMYFHGFQSPSVHEYDTLTSEDRWDETLDVIMANPPFMTPKGGIRPHKRFGIQANRSEVLFVDYIAEHLNANGRAGVIVPEGIIFQSSNAYKQLRKMLVEDRYLHAVVSLPAGVFQPYSGVKTSILLLDRELAKRTDDILFVKVENDGFDLGAQRRPIDRDDLPAVLKIMSTHKDGLLSGESLKSFKADAGCGALLVSKSSIALSGDYGLSADRYREDISVLYSEWPMVELGDTRYFRLESGGTPASENPDFWNGDVLWATLVDLPQDDLVSEITATKRTITEAGLQGSSAVVLPACSVIVSTRATIGRVAINRVPVATNQGFKSIVITDTARADCRFVAYMVTRLNPRMEMLASGGTFREISKSQFATLRIPLPPLEVQQQIVLEIDAWQKVIDGAKRVIANYKPTISVDPDWPVQELGSVCVKISDGTHQPPQFTTEGIPFLFVRNIVSGEIDFQTEKFVSEATYHTLTARFGPQKGDVLYSAVGSYGVALVVDTNRAFTFQRHIAHIRTKESMLLPHYLALYLNSPDGRRQSDRAAHGGAQRTVTLRSLSSFRIPVPPLGIQSELVSQVEEEQKLVDANKRLIEIHEQKIKAKIAEVWGE